MGDRAVPALGSSYGSGSGHRALSACLGPNAGWSFARWSTSCSAQLKNGAEPSWLCCLHAVLPPTATRFVSQEKTGAQNRKCSKKQAPLADTTFSTLNLSCFCTESQPQFMSAEHRHEPTPVPLGQTPFLLVTDRGEPSPSLHLHNQVP